MKKFIKKIITNNRILLPLANAFFLLKYSTLLRIDGSTKKYPKVLQLPITYKCNSHCVMCNIWQMNHENEMTVEEFSKFMQDPIFKEVESVGINGGEPSLVWNLPEYAKVILNLPKLKGLNTISNGFSQNLLLKELEIIYKDCRTKGVKFHVSLSLDGVGKIHDTVRGTANAFEKTTSTIDEIYNNQNNYCDSCDIGCTIVNQNVEYLIELDAYAKKKNYNIKYRLGIDNKRLSNDSIKNQYSVINSPLKQSAKEFFHYQFYRAKSMGDRFKYFSIFFWLNSSQPKRLLGCIWRDEGITMDSRGELYYCAVASNSIGSLRNGQGEEIFFDNQNIDYRKRIINHCCDGCIHDYSGKPQLKDLLFFFQEVITQRYSMKIYRIKSWLL